MGGNYKSHHLATSSYDELIDDSEFIAGIIDAHSSVVSHEGKPLITYKRLQIISRNNVLLDSIQNKYGGNMRTHPITFSRFLDMTDLEEMIALLSFASPNILLRNIEIQEILQSI